MRGFRKIIENIQEEKPKKSPTPELLSFRRMSKKKKKSKFQSAQSLAQAICKTWIQFGKAISFKFANQSYRECRFETAVRSSKTCPAIGINPVILQLIMQPLQMCTSACFPQKLRHFQGHSSHPVLPAGRNYCIDEKVRIPAGQPLWCDGKEWECLQTSLCTSCKRLPHQSPK